MHCFFCPTKDLKQREHAHYTEYSKWASCPRCRTNYTFGDTNQTKLLQYSFNTCYKQVSYTAIFDLVNTQFTIQVVTYPIREVDVIVKTNSLPNITPYTFYSKLGTYIIFS